MESRCKGWKARRDLVKLLQSREFDGDSARLVRRHSQFTLSLVKRLGLEYELEGHQGCVNCLQWSPDGKYLASGSDDTTVILWDPFRHKFIQRIPTQHIGNIFSVKFLGNNTEYIATAAGDCRVLVQTITGSESPLMECGCHVNRVKRLAVSPEEPNLFWSAGEDGVVIQYDLREAHKCPNQTKVLVDLSTKSELKCIAVNPTKPHYIAVGTNDCYVRMYDRRKMKLISVSETNQYNESDSPQVVTDVANPNCVQYYSPGHLAEENARSLNYKQAATYISFNSAGTEMLVNMGAEQIYIFEVNSTRKLSDLKVPHKGKQSKKFQPCCHSDGKALSEDSEGEDTFCNCFYMRRAVKCYKRKWMGDVYAAARDYLHIFQNWPNQNQACIGLMKCFIILGWTAEARCWLDYFQKTRPGFASPATIKGFEDSIKDLDKAHEEKDLRWKLDEPETCLRLNSKDYSLRFLGHCNTTTDIKEANFLGEDGKFICAGSDDGFIFIWERNKSNIATALIGDISIVNCVQPHPSACYLASSGIDTAVKLWSPIKEDGRPNAKLVKNLSSAVEYNQRRMHLDPFETVLANLRYRTSAQIEIDSYLLSSVPCRPS